MAKELATVYDPKSVEQTEYQKWISNKAFAADPTGSDNTYAIVIPPPNVTAALHLGHALNNTLQDILIRYRRMTGCNTLWMPGTDHAGIATQTVVEKRVLAEQGKRRTDFERDEFVSMIQDWKDEYEERILGQLKAMGCSCDWDRTRFTMDEVCAKAVRTAIFRLFADGLIYRGKRLVNWDPATQTVLADDEVEHQNVQGFFWYLQYPLTETVEIDGEKLTHITVATTRPETMLGDTAVAMNPRDPRAEVLVGKTVRLPIVGREIPIIADEYVVLADPESDDPKAKFATGFLKVTPAHDPNDYQIGLRHELEMINVMAPDGSISDRYGWDDATGSDAEQFLGLDRFEARKAIVQWFKDEKLLEDVRDYAHEVGHSYRSHVPIEPYLSDQWYIAVKKPVDSLAEKFGTEIIDGTDVPKNSLAGIALKPLLEGDLKFTPKRYENNYRLWLENLRDWPISRQLWWGHRIPIWSKRFDAAADGSASDQSFSSLADCEFITGEVDEESKVTVYACCDPASVNAPQAKLEADGWIQDSDVLDTWFSSGLWPISTMGWPEETELLNKFYPTSLLCTAREIITLWVSRMVMFGEYFRGESPFADVYIHAMIQDGEGRKMSKSLGNGIDPLNIIDSHGADALRFTLASMTTETQDVRMPVETMKMPDGREMNSSPKFDLGRSFCNKLWNASRFAMMNVEGLPTWAVASSNFTLADKWILSRLNTAIGQATTAIDNFRYNELANTLYHFTWDDFCDWYLEIAKSRINAGDNAPKAVVACVLDAVMRMLHPICPYITEALWEALAEVAPTRGPQDKSGENLLIKAAWPTSDATAIDKACEADFERLQELIRSIRQIRMTNNVAPSRKLDVKVVASGEDTSLLNNNIELIMSQANLETLEICSDAPESDPSTAIIAAGGVSAYIADVVDTAAERKRLEKELETVSKGIRGAEGKLSNEKFVQNAPAAVVESEKTRLAEMKKRLETIEQALKQLN